MTSQINTCSEANSPSLELRLGSRFDKLTLEAGQENSSASSRKVMVVEAYANGTLITDLRIPFSTVQSVLLPVTGASAVRLVFYMETEGGACTDSIVPALYNVAVS
jgi:hypothetical protein